VHDSLVFEELLDEVCATFGKPEAVAVDAGYKTPYIAKRLLDDERRPVRKDTRKKQKEGLGRKHEEGYDEEDD